VSSTFDQVHLPPTDGVGFSGSAEPLNPRVYDLITDVNNLARYVDRPVASLRAWNARKMGDITLQFPGYAISGDLDTNGADEEVWVANTCMLLPHGNVRLLWRLGVEVWAAAAKTSTLKKVNLYAASAPYAGMQWAPQSEVSPPAAPVPFDTSRLAAGYSVDSVTLGSPLTVTGGTSAYHKVDRSSGGMYPVGQLADDGQNRIAYLTLTVVANGTGAMLAGGLSDTDNALLLYDVAIWGDKA